LGYWKCCEEESTDLSSSFGGQGYSARLPSF
jgi:hypothetical protein